MATLITAALPRNAAPALSAITYAALAYAAGKEGDRDALDAGASHVFDLQISGTVDGLPVDRSLAGRLSVGRDSERASSATPNLPQVVAWILGKLNAATREAIVRDLPAEFAANGSALPEVPCGMVEAADALLGKLRATKRTKVRGSVVVEYATAPALRVVG